VERLKFCSAKLNAPIAAETASIIFLISSRSGNLGRLMLLSNIQSTPFSCKPRKLPDAEICRLSGSLLAGKWSNVATYIHLIVQKTFLW
jgi:hypothetical protein